MTREEAIATLKSLAALTMDPGADVPRPLKAWDPKADPEGDHWEADDILCQLLESLGYGVTMKVMQDHLKTSTEDFSHSEARGARRLIDEVLNIIDVETHADQV